MREMKDSGVEWIGEIPSNWEVKKLNNVANKITDYVASGSFADLNKNVQYLDEPDYAMLVRTADLSGTKDKKIYIDKSAYEFLANSNLFGGEVILSNIGSVGNVFYFKLLYERCSLAPNSIMVSDSPNNKYLYYWFVNPIANDELKRIGGNAVQLKFNKTQLKQFKVLCPPDDEQQRIVKFLDSKCAQIDSIISKQEAIIEKLKEYKLSVITEAVTKGLNPDVEMKDSGNYKIGKIPSSWSMQKMSIVCNTITDYVASGSFASLAENVKYLDDPDYAMLIRTVDVSDKGRDSKPVYIDKKAYDFLSNSNLYGGEIILPNIGASVGDVYEVPRLYERMSLAPNSIMFKTKYNDKYYYYYFLSDPGKKSLIEMSQSAAQPKFNKTELRMLRVPVPSISQQNEIVQKLDKVINRIDSQINKITEIIAKTEEYKKSLIYEVVTGKKEV